MALDKTPCRGIHRILCNADKCDSGFDKINPGCTGCPQSLFEILDLDGKVINAFPSAKSESEVKEKSKGKRKESETIKEEIAIALA